MRILALGGSGNVGRKIVQILADAEPVDEIVVASRRLEAAEAAAAPLGDRGKAARVDAKDERAVASAAKEADLVVNTAGPDFEVALPALRGAIAAGTHYVDIAADGPTTEKALALDPAAKQAGVTALTGIGSMPGLSNLLMVHAARQVEVPEEIRFCVFFPLVAWGDPAAVLEEMRRAGGADASWQTMMRWASGSVRVYEEGQWLDVDPLEAGVPVSVPMGGAATAYPVGSTEPVTLPRVLTEVRSVSTRVCLFPPQLNALYFGQGRRASASETDASGAAVAFYERVASEPDRWLIGPEGFPPFFLFWAEAVGVREGRRVRVACWPSSPWPSTVGPLAVACRKVLEGEIRTRGVLTPEACLDPVPFMTEASKYGEQAPEGELLEESVAPAD